jgi:protein O-GlcNAc transferase
VVAVVPASLIGEGIEHLRAGRLSQAKQAFDSVLTDDPQNPDALHFLGMTEHQLGQSPQGADLIRRAIAIDSGRAEFHCNLGVILSKSDPRQAAAAFEKALALQPDFPRAAANLGAVLQWMGDFDASIAVLRRLVQSHPDFAEALHNLGNSLKETGQIEEAVDDFRRAAQLSSNPAIGSNLLYALLFDPRYSQEELLAQSRRWASRFADPLLPGKVEFRNDRNPRRRLRIGYVSPDFRNHPIGRFILPALAYRDPSALETYCYSSTVVNDAFTAQARQRADVWRDVGNLSDGELAELIRRDGIDILVDLTMHLGNSRLLVVARRPAPVLVTFAAYPGTTGMKAIDYRISDFFLDPVGTSEKLYVEETRRLTTFWCYEFAAEAPEVSALPATQKGFVTFGCLNNFCKVNPGTLAAWARVLREVPGSHLRLLSPPGEHRERIIESLGVSRDRIDFVVQQKHEDYLKEYQHIDIALDTFPYNGHATGLDELWNGVPLVSLVGQTTCGRAGLSILSNVGLSELAAKSEDEFVRTAVELAKDRQRLTGLRANLRERMRQSPLMNGKRHAAELEAIYREIWGKWCD